MALIRYPKEFRFKHTDKIVLRLSDNTFWMPSCPVGYDSYTAALEILRSITNWYFVGITYKKPGLWVKIFQCVWCWEFNGQVWEPKEPGLFDVLDGKQAKSYVEVLETF